MVIVANVPIGLFKNSTIMKRRFFLMFTLLITSLTTWGQSYESIFGIDSTEWEIPFCNLDQGVIVHQISLEDTLINGLTYKKVGTKYGLTIDYSLYGSISSSNGFLREDTATGKMWFLAVTDQGGSVDTIAYLVADLSLAIGDTFVVHHPYAMDSTIVVDTVYYQAGRKYVQFNYTDPSGAQASSAQLTFIEGIGTNWGWNYMHNGLNLCRCLHSSTKDGTQVYYNSACVVIGSVTSTASNLIEVAIYPQPVTKTSTFEFENSEGRFYELNLYDLTGKMVATYQTTNSSIQLSSALYTGICFYELRLEHRKVAAGKLVFVP